MRESIVFQEDHKVMLARKILLLNFLLHHAIQKKGEKEEKWPVLIKIDPIAVHVAEISIRTSDKPSASTESKIDIEICDGKGSIKEYEG